MCTCINSVGLESWGSEVKPQREAKSKPIDHVMFGRQVVALFGSPLHIFNIKTKTGHSHLHLGLS